MNPHPRARFFAFALDSGLLRADEDIGIIPIDENLLHDLILLKNDKSPALFFYFGHEIPLG